MVRNGSLMLFAALAAAGMLAGCKIVTIADAQALRARHGTAFDARAEVARIWPTQALPALNHAAVPITDLVAAIDANLPAAGGRFGRRTGEGAPWTFVARGDGVVTSVDRRSRRGQIEIAVTGLAQGRDVRLQIGPVVAGTAIRDALPFVTFDKFPDQLAFADIGRALTARAMSDVGAHVAGVRPGARVRFVGAFNVEQAGHALVLTPVSLAPAATNVS